MIALLRVIIYTVDNTAFDGEVPTVLQWIGPPPTIVQVQVILFASLSASLFTFLAIFGKRRLDRCIPVDMREPIVERGRCRQRKLDDIVDWYFDHVMESLLLVAQAALLLLGCALSRSFGRSI